MAHPYSAYPRQGMYIPQVGQVPIARAVNEPNWAGPRGATVSHIGNMSAAYLNEARSALNQQTGPVSDDVVSLMARPSYINQIGSFAQKAGGFIESQDIAASHRAQQMRARDDVTDEAEDASFAVAGGAPGIRTTAKERAREHFDEVLTRVLPERAARRALVPPPDPDLPL